MLTGIKLKRVDSMHDAEEFMRWLGESRQILALDTETIGLSWWQPNFTRLIQFGDTKTGWVLGTHAWQGLADEALRRYDGPVVAHNAKFDMHALRVSGVAVPHRHQWHDTMLMHSLLYPLERHGLKDVSEKLIDHRAGWMGQDLAKTMKDNKWTWATVPYNVVLYSGYAGLDTILCARLYEKLFSQIEKRFLEQYEVEMQVSNIMYETEKRGLRVDMDYCYKLLERYELNLEQLAGKLAFFGITNPSADKQVTQYLVEFEGWEPQEYTASGKIKFNRIIKDSLNFEVVDLCKEYARTLKWSSYVRKMILTNDNGIVYPSIKTFEAKTGRMSIGSDKKEKETGTPVSIPFQQLPHVYEARRPILPRYEGYVLRPIDYDSQEIRVLAHYANDPGLLEAVQQSDLHIYTAEKIYGELITKEDPRRTIAKMCRYLQVYGGGAEKLSKAVGISLEEAEHFKAMDNQTFPGIKRFQREIQTIGKNRYRADGRGWIESHYGREIEVESPKYIKGEFVEFFYKLCNYIIQGSCADLLKRKIIALDSAGYTEFIDLPVHDELLISVPDSSEGNEIAHEMRDIMEEHRDFVVPLTCELSKPYSNWGSKYLASGEKGWDELTEEQDVTHITSTAA